jgi:hypothetical protein
MGLRRAFRRNRPRIGCIALSVLAAPTLSCALGLAISTLPAPDPMPREAVLESFAAERAEAERLGFVLERELEAEHEDASTPDREALRVAAGECVAVVAGVWGSQSPGTLALRRAGSGDVSRDEATGRRVAHVQWCAERAEALEVELARVASDVYEREGHRSAGVKIAILRGPSTPIGGLRRLTRGAVPDEELARMTEHVMDAANARIPAGASRLAELSIESFEARLIPEDATMYRELHRAAQNGSSRVVRPRFAPLPDTVPAAWRPGVVGPRTAEQLRRQARPSDEAGESHPAVGITSDGMQRVLAVIDAARLGVRCADVHWVRHLYGHRAVVRRVRSDRREATELRAVDNAAFDRLCGGDGTVLYVVSPDDQERYTLRVYEAR